MEYDTLTPKQKKWVCEATKNVVLCTRGKKGRSGSISDAVGNMCRNMPAGMAGMVDAFARAVHAGEMTVESLDTI